MKILRNKEVISVNHCNFDSQTIIEIDDELDAGEIKALLKTSDLIKMQGGEQGIRMTFKKLNLDVK